MTGPNTDNDIMIEWSSPPFRILGSQNIRQFMRTQASALGVKCSNNTVGTGCRVVSRRTLFLNAKKSLRAPARTITRLLYAMNPTDQCTVL